MQFRAKEKVPQPISQFRLNAVRSLATSVKMTTVPNHICYPDDDTDVSCLHSVTSSNDHCDRCRWAATGDEHSHLPPCPDRRTSISVESQPLRLSMDSTKTLCSSLCPPAVPKRRESLLVSEEFADLLEEDDDDFDLDDEDLTHAIEQLLFSVKPGLEKMQRNHSKEDYTPPKKPLRRPSFRRPSLRSLFAGAHSVSPCCSGRALSA